MVPAHPYDVVIYPSLRVVVPIRIVIFQRNARWTMTSRDGQARLAALTNGQAGELEQAAAELRENPYDLATLYNDYAVKYQVRVQRDAGQTAYRCPAGAAF